MSPGAILVAMGLVLGVLVFGALPARLLGAATPGRLGLVCAFGAGTLLGPQLTAIPDAHGRASGQVAAWLAAAGADAGIPDVALQVVLLIVQIATLALILAAYGLGWRSLRDRAADTSAARRVAVLIVAALALRGAAAGIWPATIPALEPTSAAGAVRLIVVSGLSAIGAFAFAPLLVRAAWPAALALAAGLVAFAPPLVLAFTVGPLRPAVPIVVAVVLVNIYALAQLLHIAQAKAGGGLETTAAVGLGAILTWRDSPVLAFG